MNLIGKVITLFENDDVLIVDKPAGLLTHPKDAQDKENSLVSFIRGKVNDTDELRPGIVHRLDRDTSGCIIIAKNIDSKEFLYKKFKNREVTKQYVALVDGILNEKLKINVPIGRSSNINKFKPVASGKESITFVDPIDFGDNKTLLHLMPKTGRTHQLRVHMQHIGHPIIGDVIYGRSAKSAPRLLLDAKYISYVDANGNLIEATSKNNEVEDIFKSENY